MQNKTKNEYIFFQSEKPTYDIHNTVIFLYIFNIFTYQTKTWATFYVNELVLTQL